MAEIWSRLSADPREAQGATMRATDGDRDEVLSLLRDAYADGRLARQEYDERTDAVLVSRTVGSLLPVVADLVPASPPAVRASPISTGLHAEAVKRYGRDLRDARNGWIFVSTITLAIWAATSIANGGPYFFWPAFPIIGVGIGYFSTRLNAESSMESIEDKLTQRARRSDDA